MDSDSISYTLVESPKEQSPVSLQEASLVQGFLKEKFLQVASCLTNPVCRFREHFYTLYLRRELALSTRWVVTSVPVLLLEGACVGGVFLARRALREAMNQRTMQSALRALGFLVFYPLCTLIGEGALLLLIPALLGMGLRFCVTRFQREPFLVEQREIGEKKTDSSFKIWWWNVCLVKGGYNITDGNTNPFPSRRDAIIGKIRDACPNIVCLGEVGDIEEAQEIAKQLNYHLSIHSMGPRGVGPSSMMMVLSQCPLEEMEFTPFKPGEELTGRAQNSTKGFFSFTIKDSKDAVIISHLQHSEEPARPESSNPKKGILGDRESRHRQMQAIALKAKALVEKEFHVTFLGDLNQGEEELESSLRDLEGINWQRNRDAKGGLTWFGDSYIAQSWFPGFPQWFRDWFDNGKGSSDPMVLDYALFAGDNIQAKTKILSEMGYYSDGFSPEALSDHGIIQVEKGWKEGDFKGEKLVSYQGNK